MNRPAVPDFDAVVADVYAAAAQSHLWPAALSSLASLTHSRGALITQPCRTHDGLLCSPSLNDTVSQFFAQGWHHDDLRTVRMVSKAPRSFICDQDITTSEERERSDYYRGFAHSAGVPWFAACGLMVDGAPAIGISIQRSAADGAFEASDLARLHRIEPHLKAAMSFSRTVADRACEARLDALDQSGVAAFILDREGVLRGVNGLGEAELGRAVVVRRRRLTPLDRTAREAFARLILNAATTTENAGARDLRPVRMMLADGETRLAQAMPLRGEAHRFGDGRAILTLSGATPVGALTSLLAAAFGLTPAEARVAHHLSRGLEPEEIAVRCGISVGAVRFHLKSILPKAGVRRQAAFVALAATIRRT